MFTGGDNRDFDPRPYLKRDVKACRPEEEQLGQKVWPTILTRSIFIFHWDQKDKHMAVAQKTGTKMGCPGKWKHGPKPAVCPSWLILSHSHIKSWTKKKQKFSQDQSLPCQRLGLRSREPQEPQAMRGMRAMCLRMTWGRGGLNWFLDLGRSFLFLFLGGGGLF